MTLVCALALAPFPRAGVGDRVTDTPLCCPLPSEQPAEPQGAAVRCAFLGLLQVLIHFYFPLELTPEGSDRTPVGLHCAELTHLLRTYTRLD